MSTSGSRPLQRRGLGRGLGSLIPTAPAAPPDGDGAAEGTGSPVDGSGRSSAPGGVLDPSDGPAPEASSDRPAAGAAPAASTGPSTVDGLAPVDGAYFAEIPVDEITPNHVQPRQVFDQDAMAELVHSIREIGVLQPVVVRRRTEGGYELVMGERRWRATQRAGLATIPAIVRETDDVDMLRDALLENLHRSELNPLEEAAAYQQLLEDFGCTHEELATRIGRSRPQISNTLRLLKLSPAVQRRVAAGVLSAGHARALLSVEDADLQDRLAQRVVAEGISVRGLEEIVAVRDLDSPGPRVARRKAVAPGLTDLADRLSDRFETRVKVDLGRSKGKITVEFATVDDLQRIVDIMDPRNRTDRPI
jgi:ParB family chromosome partitioning protein